MDELFTQIEIWLEASGMWAFVLAPAVMAAVAVLPIPAELPAMVNGAIFGPWLGTLITYVGAMAGAQISFELSRRLGRPAAERLVSPATLRRCDEIVEGAGWWGMLLPRFVPLIAFTALNWCAGLTPVSRWRFFWTTAVGIVPGVILFTVSGVGMAALARRYPLSALALAALVVAVWAWHRQRGRRSPGRRSPAVESTATAERE